MSNITSQLDNTIEDIIDLHRRMELTKYLALASCAFLIHDILSTLPGEVRYVWGSRWSFGRVAFHMNRIWAPVLLSVYVPSLFGFYQTNEKYLKSLCIFNLLFNIYGTMALMIIANSILITRVWVIYDMKKSIIVILGTFAAAICIPSIIIIRWRAQRCELTPNPAPNIVSGCSFSSTSLVTMPYIAPFLFDTTLFLMTVYKLWKGNTPLMSRLLGNGVQYYVIVMGTFLIVGFSQFIPPIHDAINGSGLFIAILSSMCTRLIISTRSYYNDAVCVHGSHRTTSVTQNVAFRTTEWRVSENSTSINEGFGSFSRVEQKV